MMLDAADTLYMHARARVFPDTLSSDENLPKRKKKQHSLKDESTSKPISPSCSTVDDGKSNDISENISQNYAFTCSCFKSRNISRSHNTNKDVVHFDSFTVVIAEERIIKWLCVMLPLTRFYSSLKEQILLLGFA